MDEEGPAPQGDAGLERRGRRRRDADAVREGRPGQVHRPAALELLDLAERQAAARRRAGRRLDLLRLQLQRALDALARVVNSDVEVGTEVDARLGRGERRLREAGGRAPPPGRDPRDRQPGARTRRSSGRRTPRAPGGRRRPSSQAGPGARAPGPQHVTIDTQACPLPPDRREDELDRVETFLAAVERGPAILVLSGEAGIGKTALWETGLAEAERRFGHVLVCRGVEAEASFSFAGLSELVATFSTRSDPRCWAPAPCARGRAAGVDRPGRRPIRMGSGWPCWTWS